MSNEAKPGSAAYFEQRRRETIQGRFSELHELVVTSVRMTREDRDRFAFALKHAHEIVDAALRVYEARGHG